MNEHTLTLPEPAPRVALVGRRCDDNLNLGLDYLLAALDEARISGRVLILNHWQQLESICETILQTRPAIVGLSLTDGGSAFLPLGLGELLSRRGYRGHVTCGGQFATLARAWLLSRYPWLHSVIRFAGEAPIVALAGALAGGDDWRTVPGLTSRAGDGQPAPLLDPSPLRLIPRRDHHPEILGFTATHIAATRGCRGRCSYCGPASLLCLEKREAAGAGIDAARRRQAGIGGVKRRDLDAVCDEMAQLHHERGVRYFYFVDEHLLPYEEDRALMFLGRWRAGLRRRGVRRPGIGTMLRTDRVTPRLARAFARAGLVRVFLGIEFGTELEGRQFGRRLDLPRVPGLLRAFDDAGVTTVSNLMLLHPYTTPGTIRAGLDLLERLPVGLCEINQMQVYHGTRLHGRLEAEGRIVGNPLRYHYTFEDRTVARFAEIFWRLRAEALRDYSVVFRSHDAALGLALAARLHPSRRDELRAPRRRLDRIAGRIRRLYVRTLGRALSLAGAPGGGHAEALIEETAQEVRELIAQQDRQAAAVAAALGKPGRVFSPMRAAAATALSFVMAGGLGCDHRTVSTDAARADITVDSSKDRDQGRCPEPVKKKQGEDVKKAVLARVPCFTGYVNFPADGSDPRALASTYSTSLSFCKDPASELLIKNRGAAAVKAILDGKLQTDCLPGAHVQIQGGQATDQDRLRQTILQKCALGGMNKLYGAQIVLDSAGKVIDVVARPGKTPQPGVLVCIKQALQGLTFPCLGGTRVCPEFVIVE